MADNLVVVCSRQPHHLHLSLSIHIMFLQDQERLGDYIQICIIKVHTGVGFCTFDRGLLSIIGSAGGVIFVLFCRILA